MSKKTRKLIEMDTEEQMTFQKVFEQFVAFKDGKSVIYRHNKNGHIQSIR